MENLGGKVATVGDLVFEDTNGEAMTSYSYTGSGFPGDAGTCEDVIEVGARCSIEIKFSGASGRSVFIHGVQRKT